MLYGKDSTKPATFFGVGKVYDGRALHIGKKCAWLSIYAEVAEEMAGRVISEHPVPACTYVGYAEYVYKIFCKFVGALGESVGAGKPNFIISEEFEIAVAKHPYAGT